jgi:hypothetical protein
MTMRRTFALAMEASFACRGAAPFSCKSLYHFWLYTSPSLSLAADKSPCVGDRGIHNIQMIVKVSLWLFGDIRLLNSTQNSLHLCSSNVIADTVHFCFPTFERKKKEKKTLELLGQCRFGLFLYGFSKLFFFCFSFNVFSLLRKCGMMNSFLSDILFLGHPYTHQSSNT